MADALRPIDIRCPACNASSGKPCKGSQSASFPWKRFHPERFEGVGMSALGASIRTARPASEAPVPYADPRVCFIWNTGVRTSANHLQFAITVAEKIALLTGKRRHVYCVWPGMTRSDLFYIDDHAAALRELDGR